MESKMALTTPSTSRCVSSGKSVHSFCTSSERIIGNPAADSSWTRCGPAPYSPKHGGRLGATLSGNLASRKTEVKAASRKETPPFELLLLFGLRFRSRRLLFQGCSQDVAQRGPGVGRAILRDRLLLLSDLHRLDREVGLLRTIEADHQSVELLPDLEALGALLVAVAAEIRALGEAGHTVVADLNVEPGILDGADRDGQHIA